MLADRVCAFLGAAGTGVDDALAADCMVFSSAASGSIATGLVAMNETRRDAKALWRLPKGVVFDSISVVVFAAAFDFVLGAWDPEGPDI